MKNNKKFMGVMGKIALSVLIIYMSYELGIIPAAIAEYEGLHMAMGWVATSVLTVLAILLLFVKNKKHVFISWGIYTGICVIAILINVGMIVHEKNITIDTAPNIEVEEYLPFDKDSKIVELDHEASLKLEDNLPVIDGAAALFPVYSAFVNETYPNTVKLGDGVFEYNNTATGYKLLSERKTDIFFGAKPASWQSEIAKKNGTTFVYTPIGSEAFVFFVHKNNPIESLTTEQIKGIYSGKITNWKEVGGRDEEIVAFQRNEGSGSQSMLVDFMDGEKLMDPPIEQVNDLMSGIIEEVADYKNKTNSIGFSFRYYVEGIIQNPDIKLIGVDGVAPTIENIQTEKYPIITPIYAVTYEENENENVDKLLQWVVSSEGQEILEKTGYVGLGK